MRKSADPFADIVRKRLRQLYKKHFGSLEEGKKTKAEKRRIRRRFERSRIVISACRRQTDAGDVTKPPSKR